MRALVKLAMIDELKSNLGENLKLIQVILGPRQVGKTTTMLQFLENEYGSTYKYVSADKVFHASPNWLREQWQECRRKESLLVIDEVQKIENWAETIKALWDEDKKNGKRVQCVLLGSSSLEIHKGLTESLTGRFKLIRTYHWNFRESKEGYGLNFDEFLRYGGYPGSYLMAKKPSSWADYVRHSIIETVVEKDILLNHTVKSPALFKQAFDMLMSYPAQEISYTKLLGQLQGKGNVEVIKYYIRLYEAAFLLRALPKYSTSTLKVRSSSPKILPLAPALYYLNILEEYKSEERGRVFELLVGAQLVRTGLDLFYWREKNDEVDYVLKQGRKIWAIEVKSGRRKSERGLLKFKEKFSNAKLAIITPENYDEFEADPVKFLESVS